MAPALRSRRAVRRATPDLRAGLTRPGRLARLVVIVAAALGLVLASAATATAHDAIVGSTPEGGAVLSEPIDQAILEFGEDVEILDIALYPDDADRRIDTTWEALSPTSVLVRFEQLSEEGTYFLRYLANEPASDDEDEHTLAGAISFTYGSATDSAFSDSVITVLPWAIIILLVGAVLSFRRNQIQISKLRDADA